MTRRYLSSTVIVVMFHVLPGALCGAAETGLRFVVASPAGIERPDAPEVVVPVGPSGGDVVLEVLLRTALEPCAASPPSCTGDENFREQDPLTFEDVFGCADGLDNDEDGLIDFEDLECLGVSGWSFSVVTEPCFNVAGVTLAGTVADLESSPPGLRDPEGSFQQTVLVDPELNDGKEGIVTAVVLSFQRPIFVPPVGDWTVLELRGRLDAAGEEVGPPCAVSIPGPDMPGLVGVLEPVHTVVTVRGQSLTPEVRDTVLRPAPGSGTGTSFRRGDCNADGEQNLTDGVFLLNYLFLQGPLPPCQAACDANADGELNITAAVFLLNYLFLEGPPPPAPFPGCGPGEPAPLSCRGATGCV